MVFFGPNIESNNQSPKQNWPKHEPKQSPLRLLDVAHLGHVTKAATQAKEARWGRYSGEKYKESAELNKRKKKEWQ